MHTPPLVIDTGTEGIQSALSNAGLLLELNYGRSLDHAHNKPEIAYILAGSARPAA